MANWPTINEITTITITATQSFFKYDLLNNFILDYTRTVLARPGLNIQGLSLMLASHNHFCKGLFADFDYFSAPKFYIIFFDRLAVNFNCILIKKPFGRGFTCRKIIFDQK